MGQWKKRIAVLGVAGALAISSLTGCSGSMKNDDVVATVGDSEIPLGIANFYARMTQAQYESYYAGMMGTTGEEMWSKEAEEGKTYEQTVKATLIQSLENLYLLEQHAADYDIELTDEEKKQIEKTAKTFDDDNTLEDKEAVSGYEKYVKRYLELVTIQKKMEGPMKAGVNEEVSDEEAAQKSMQYVYFPYTATDDSGSSVKLTDDEKSAVKEKAQTFADALKSKTAEIDSAAAEAGVEVKTATFDGDSTAPDADLVSAVDALTAEGDTTDVVETDSGLYVGKLTSLLDREATDKEKTAIVKQRQQEQYDSRVKQWRKETDISVNKKVWKKVSFEKLGVTVKEGANEYEDSSADKAE